MGEIIKKLGDINIKGQLFDIELNVSTYTEGKREIHIQNKSFRLAIPEHEFLKMSACILLARKQLEIIKGYSVDKK